MSRIFVCGDIHGDYDIKKLSTKNWKEQKKLTKDDFLTVLGDFGLPWSCQVRDGVTSINDYNDIIMSKEDLYWLNWLVAKKFTTLVVLGNHEGVYSILKYLPKVYYEPIKGYVRELKLENGSIYYLSRDEVYTINNARYLVIGGATSIDKASRLPGVTWWKEEDLTKHEIDNVLDLIEQNNKFDYVLSHTCPSWLIPELVYDVYKINDFNAKFLEHVENLIEFDEWHFGHFHVHHTYIDSLNNKFICHYNNEPYELNK